MSWDILPRDVQGIIIDHLGFDDNFIVLSQVNSYFLKLTLQFINCKAMGDFCYHVYDYLFALRNNINFRCNQDDLILMLDNFLQNKSIDMIWFLTGLLDYRSRDVKCCLNDIYKIILKRLSYNITNEEMGMLIRIYKQMLMQCTVDFDSNIKVEPTLLRIKMISDFLNHYIETKHNLVENDTLSKKLE